MALGTVTMYSGRGNGVERNKHTSCWLLGVGSPQPGDDAGWRVVEHIHRFALLPGWECHALDRPGLGLLDYFHPDRHILLVDSMLSHDTPGSLLELQPEALIQTSRALSTHAVGVAEALALAQTIGLWPRSLRIFGVVVASVEEQNLLDPERFLSSMQQWADTIAAAGR